MADDILLEQEATTGTGIDIFFTDLYTTILIRTDKNRLTSLAVYFRFLIFFANGTFIHDFLIFLVDWLRCHCWDSATHSIDFKTNTPLKGICTNKKQKT